MRVAIVAIGRLKAEAERALVARYAERIAGQRSASIGPLRVIELPESQLASAAERRLAEGRHLLRYVTAGVSSIALDERGKLFSSRDLASWLGKRRDAGCRDVAFLIGGPDGHAAAVLDEADLVLSLGPLTLPHGLARVVLAEQIYRATTILTGHPYHRD